MKREEFDPLSPFQVPRSLIVGTSIIMGGGFVLLGALCFVGAQFDVDAINDVRARWAIRFVGGAACFSGVFVLAGFSRHLARDEGVTNRDRLLRCLTWGSLVGMLISFAGFLSVISSYLLEAARAEN